VSALAVLATANAPAAPKAAARTFDIVFFLAIIIHS